jgi:glycosyltransferase involved in cell wall biosynthesis
VKILLVNYEFPPIGGGASTASYGLALELARRGHSIHVLTSRYRQQAPEESIDGIRVFRVRSWRRGVHNAGYRGALTYLMFGAPKLRRLLKETSYDVIHYFFGVPTGLLTVLCPSARRIPYIVSFRGSDVPGYDQGNRLLGVLHGVLRPVTGRIWKHAALLVANSHELKRLAERAAPGNEIRMIPNGAPDRDSPDRPPLPASGRPFRLLCVSRLVPRKGVDYLIEAVANLPPSIALDIVGTGSREKRLRKLAETLGAGDRVHFHGYRPRDELSACYERADLFVLPSLCESCSMSLLEAMSHGLPIVATNVGGTPELVENHRNGLLVAPGDAAALGSAIRRLSEDHALRSRMGEANVSRVRNGFTVQDMAAAYVTAYEQVMRRREAAQSTVLGPTWR